MNQDAIALTQHLDRAHAGAGPTENVVGEDDPGGRRGIVHSEGGDESRDVDLGRAASDARRRRVHATTCQTAIRFGEGRTRRQRRAKLA